MWRLIKRLDGAQVDYPLGERLWPYIAARAEAAPDAAACIHDGQVLSYATLCARVRALACRLADAGVRSGQVVAVSMVRSDTLLVTLLALSKLGAAYLALDTRWPEARCRQAIDVARCGYVITGQRDAAAAGAAEPFAIRSVNGRSDETPPEALFCVYFTSGSSGRPKAAAAPASGILRIAFDAGLRFSESTRMLQLAPPPWDAFALELWCPLIRGGTTIIHPQPLPTAESIRSHIVRDGVNTLFLTTALFNLLVDEDIEIFAGLGCVMCGGERVSPHHIARFSSAHPGVPLIHVYGPVESSIFATAHQVVNFTDGDVPIGVPVANTSVLLVYDDQEARKSEHLGEIVLAGDGLASGYISDLEETRRCFVTDPSLGRENEILYFTGDLAWLDQGNRLIFHGRRDSQLKINGIRIEPDEIRHFTELMSEVAKSVVVAVPVHEPVKSGVVLFYTLRRGCRLDREAMRQRLAAHFPLQYVPLVVVQVGDIPLGESGKTSSQAFQPVLRQLRLAPLATRDLQDITLLEREISTLLAESVS